MEGQCSKKSGDFPPDIQIDGGLLYTAELSSYEAACKLDPDLQSFDSTLQIRTNPVINTLADGVEVRSLSFNSLKEVIGCLLEMNQEVVKVILEGKNDVWKNEELFDLEEYFDNSLQTLDFCTALEKCLKRARDSQLIIHAALQQFEEADGNYQKTSEELRNFRMAGKPFTEGFFQLFLSVYKQHSLMLEKLQARNGQLDKKLKSVKARRKLSRSIFVAALAVVLIGSVVAAAMAAPRIAAALAAATSIPIGSMGKWIDSLLRGYEVAIRGKKEVISSMHVGTYVAIKDLDSIRVLVGKLTIEIESLLLSVDFTLQEEEAVKLGVNEIKKKLTLFIKSIEDLSEHADRCSRDIQMARRVALQRIIKHPN